MERGGRSASSPPLQLRLVAALSSLRILSREGSGCETETKEEPEMLNNLPAKWDYEADIVAIGSGIGGLSAAITAHDLGSSALVLERSDQVGGVTALSMGEVWVAGNHHAAAKGIEDSVESGYRYLKRLSMDYGSDLAILNMVAHAREALQYFEDKIGLRMAVITSCPDYYYTVTNDAVAEGRMLEVRAVCRCDAGRMAAEDPTLAADALWPDP